MRLKIEHLEDRLTPAFPIAVNDAFTILPGTSTALNVLANDSFPGSLNITNFTQPANGQVRLNGDGTIQFTPETSFRQSTFDYTVSPRTPETILTAETPAADDLFGKAIVSADGNTLIASADTANIGGIPDAGRAFVFIRTDTGWVRTQTLTASDPSTQSRFGFAMALSADASILAIGAPGGDVNNVNAAGQVYLFQRTANGSYSQTQILNNAPTNENANFGGSLAISGDGNRLVVGAINTTINGQTEAGRVIVYRRTGSTFAEQQTITAPTPTSGDGFGNLALSRDGRTLAVGALGTDVNGLANAGKVYVYRGTDTLTLAQQITSPDPEANQLFGNSAIALDADGSTLLIGVLLGDVGATANAGEVFVYQRGNSFTFTQTLTAPTPTANDGFGAALSITPDGNTVVIGAPLRNTNNLIDAGQGFRFTAAGAGYAFADSFIASDASAGDNLGNSVSISADGNTIAWGAPTADVGNVSNAGTLYLQQRGTSTATVTLTRTAEQSPRKLSTTGPVDAAGRIFGFNSAGQAQQENTFVPFDGYIGTIQATTGDVNGDGIFDVIYGIGPLGGSTLRVVDGISNQDIVAPFSTFEPTFSGGIFVAAGDIDGDGRAEVVVSPDVGGGGRIQVFGFVDGQFSLRDNFFGIDDINFRGGARVALGDLNGDGRQDLIVGAGFGGGPRIALFDGGGLLRFENAPPKLIGDFFAFPGPDASTLRDGVFVSAGDLNGDGAAEIIFGGGPGGGPRVFVLRGPQLLADVAAAQNNPLANFFVNGDVTSRGGVRVTAKDVDGDGLRNLVVGSGQGLPTTVRTYSSNFPSDAGEPALIQEFDPFGLGPLATGVFVG